MDKASVPLFSFFLVSDPQVVAMSSKCSLSSWKNQYAISVVTSLFWILDIQLSASLHFWMSQWNSDSLFSLTSLGSGGRRSEDLQTIYISYHSPVLSLSSHNLFLFSFSHRPRHVWQICVKNIDIDQWFWKCGVTVRGVRTYREQVDGEKTETKTTNYRPSFVWQCSYSVVFYY